MDRIVAPYNFVPLSEHVYEPEHSARASHDMPYRDGVTALIRYRIVAETAVIVRGSAEREVRFFRTPDQKVAIPGSSVRGMIRNVVEIASFGRMSRVNDHTYGVRDLHNRDVYVQYMAEIRQVPDPRGRGTKSEPVPLVSAGWLRQWSADERAAWRATAHEGRAAATAEDDPNDVVAEIVPCDFFKIEYGRLTKLAGERGVRGFSPGDRQSSAQKYRVWGSASRDVKVEVRVFRPTTQTSAAGVPFLGEAGVVVDRGMERSGQIVFTGQPSPWRMDPNRRPGAGSAKHHDFVFSPGPDAVVAGPGRLLVTRRQLDAFEFIHADRGQQKRLQVDPNEEWGHWRPAFQRGERVPVFVLPERDGSLRAFGLAMMFRLAYRHSVREAAHQEGAGLDLADTVFGIVPAREKEGAPALRGRISVGVARAAEPCRELPAVTAVLGAPKASYYPNYIEQSADPYQPGALPSAAYKTLMDDDVRIRGWKRYRPQAKANARPEMPERASDKVKTTFVPVAPETVFEGVIRVHNLRCEELGAIVWASRFGGDAKGRHTIGMARSLGYGRVRMELAALEPLQTNAGEPTTLDDCEKRFAARMEAWAASQGIPGGWRGSLQVTQLVACAQPCSAEDEVRHLRIAPFNEFVQAKKDKLALRPAADVKAWRDRTPGVPVYVAPTKIEAPSQGARPAVATKQVAGSAPKATPVAAAVAAVTALGKISYFSNGFVGLTLADGRKVKAQLGRCEFVGFSALNGNEFKGGRAVVVALQGDAVVRVAAN